MNYKSINHQAYLAEDKMKSGHKLLIKTQHKESGNVQYYVGVIKDIVTDVQVDPIVFVTFDFNNDIYDMMIDLAIVEMLIVDIEEIL